MGLQLERLSDSTQKLIEIMIGRSMGNEFPPRTCKPKDKVVLSTRNLSDGYKIKDVSIELKEGEVQGIAGLVGSGRTEVLWAIYGADPGIKGQITAYPSYLSHRNCQS